MPESDYNVEGSSRESNRGIEEQEEAANNWRKNIQTFKLPTVADDEYLDGCKVRWCDSWVGLNAFWMEIARNTEWVVSKNYIS